jgi:hypothetical protein
MEELDYVCPGPVGLLATLSLAFRDTPSWTVLGWQTVWWNGWRLIHCRCGLPEPGSG